MFYRVAFVALVCTAFGWNVWRYPVVEQILTGGAVTELRYLRDDLPESSPRTAVLLQSWGEKISSLVKKSSSDAPEDGSGDDDSKKPPAPAPAKGVSRSSTPRTAPASGAKSSDNSLLPPLPQGDMPIPKAASSWGSVSAASPAEPSVESHSLAESDATPLLASRFVESPLSPIPPPATTPPSSNEPPPLVVAPPAPLAGGVWMPPAL